jgi:hypothetical protein
MPEERISAGLAEAKQGLAEAKRSSAPLTRAPKERNRPGFFPWSIPEAAKQQLVKQPGEPQPDPGAEGQHHQV